jgi:hypothetical protein
LGWWQFWWQLAWRFLTAHRRFAPNHSFDSISQVIFGKVSESAMFVLMAR